jgi:hypothetical protein
LARWEDHGTTLANATLVYALYFLGQSGPAGWATRRPGIRRAGGEGRITCENEVVHRTRRTATAEAKVHDADGNLVALGTGAFRVFEKPGNAIV